jgi:hypothetical protein
MPPVAKAMLIGLSAQTRPTSAAPGGRQPTRNAKQVMSPAAAASHAAEIAVASTGRSVKPSLNPALRMIAHSGAVVPRTHSPGL